MSGPHARRVLIVCWFGVRLRAERHRQVLKLEDMNERADMNWSCIAGIERGERNISIDNMSALAAAVGLPLWALLQPGA